MTFRLLVPLKQFQFDRIATQVSESLFSKVFSRGGLIKRPFEGSLFVLVSLPDFASTTLE